ncbi:acetyl-CoA acetyltransferase [Thecamonas trahens ATCC 50062]|uniref:Acetyl-CoA acetyltransferase n=1 Tax=Thecamonas trahens ATCC 50062 TaxID=461836 RepID=A0A0L0DN30_THETB|nr:acetyl-CoA acetyltransferase [Thecamonas trahens ATCC 50062]KNC53431.1 acetyl-CoA acetyltransferase [Thecamonas trahens ATCC 50062]|eukprot:XP_013754466.1 acetyl-CoA acetyltransferase [Thecamonas trahens ATCC 50062]
MAATAGRDVYIVEAVRTPIARGKANGALHNMHPVSLLAQTLAELVSRANVSPEHIEDVIGGVVTPKGKQGANVPRLALLKAGFPVSVPGVQINRMCGSSQQAAHFAAQAIASGDMDVVVASGVEMMSVEKMGSDVSMDGLSELVADGFPHQLVHQGQSAELVAEKSTSLMSHARASAAIAAGHFNAQTFPITVTDADGRESVFSRDEGVRASIDRTKMAQLRTIFKADGVVTAGNASQVSDGAAAVLFASGPAADALGLRKRARVVTRVVVGSDPVLMLDGVIPATRKALKAAGLTIEDIDVIEINEAFASVVLAWRKALAPRDGLARVNPNGGSIAHGHPLGATGCVLLTKAVHELERIAGRYALVVMCIGHGQATCTIIERVTSSKL